MNKKKSLPQLKKDLEKVFNAYVRERDKDKPCISCGQWKPLQAGHFYPVKGYDALRFYELNVHGECASCNLFDQMHLLNYAANLPGRIGEDGCKTLREMAEDYKKNGYKWTRDELELLLITYKNKLKNL